MTHSRTTMTMARFFEALGAPLKNTRWSWGAQRADGAVFLRQWESDVFKGDDGEDYVRIAHRNHSPGPHEHGWRERLRHIESIRAGAPSFLVMVAAEDVTAPKKTVKAFDARSIIVGGRLVTKDGATSIQVMDRRPVSQFIKT